MRGEQGAVLYAIRMAMLEDAKESQKKTQQMQDQIVAGLPLHYPHRRWYLLSVLLLLLMGMLCVYTPLWCRLKHIRCKPA